VAHDRTAAVVSARPKILLINPRIVSRPKARFPLSLLALAGALEGEYDCRIVDGNIEPDGTTAALDAMRRECFAAVGVTVMGGPQVATAIDVSRAIRAESPHTPIAWGGYFPTLYPDAALNASYVDYLVRGQGETALRHLLEHLSGAATRVEDIAGLSWKREQTIVHNADRPMSRHFAAGRLPYELLGDPRKYLVRTFLGQRTAAHQAAIGCRFRCTFCGVAAMFRGATALPPAAKLEHELIFLRDRIGADSLQFCDHNFFDREADMIPILEVLARVQLPWWCYARADALLAMSQASWSLARRSRMRMAYIGAESPSDTLLRDIRKGTRADQTLAVAELCARQGVIPELSFMVAPPNDPEGETERTFEFIRHIKRINPRAEIIVYVYTPLPASSVPERMRSKVPQQLHDSHGRPIQFPTTPEEWTQRRWVDYSCHADAPWVSDRLRRRIRDFGTVLGCRFPTVQDVKYSSWTKAPLRALASWRYRFRKYDRPWELNASRRLIRLVDPRATSF
jgi:anaerobic magnesium-protoporphyrin IX monomethyl ester cyclase